MNNIIVISKAGALGIENMYDKLQLYVNQWNCFEEQKQHYGLFLVKEFRIRIIIFLALFFIIF